MLAHGILAFQIGLGLAVVWLIFKGLLVGLRLVLKAGILGVLAAIGWVLFPRK